MREHKSVLFCVLLLVAGACVGAFLASPEPTEAQTAIPVAADARYAVVPVEGRVTAKAILLDARTGDTWRLQVPYEDRANQDRPYEWIRLQFKEGHAP